MGWLRTLFLGDIGNRLDIGDNETRIRGLRSALRRNTRVDQQQSTRIDELQRRCDRLELSVEVLSQMLVERGHLPEAELRRLLAVASEPEPDDE